MSIDITPAQTKDLTQIRTILKENELPFSDVTEHHLERFRVIRKGKQLIAVIGTEVFPPYALLRSLAVSPACRNRGLAAALVISVESELHREGIESVYLLTTTASAYFGKMGYKSIKRNSVPTFISGTAEFRSLCPDTAVCMMRQLPQG